MRQCIHDNNAVWAEAAGAQIWRYTWRMTRFLAVVLVLWCGPAFSQTTSPAPAFEVASVKVAGPFQPGPSGPRGGPGTNDPTRFTYPRANLQALMMRAYGVRSDQISGPDWIRDYADDRTMYAITAVVPPDTSKEQFNLMLQNLLAERFHLALHHESKEFPGYELVVAEGGPKIKPYVPQENTGDDSGGGRGRDENGFPRLGPNASVAFSMSTRGGWAMQRARYRMPMAQFVMGLGAAINESNGADAGVAMPRVTDKTGLTGIYEFTLGFAGLTAPIGSAGDPAAPTVTDPGEVGPTLFKAIEEQLGLKLVKTKNVSVDILVIDRADKVPAEN